MNAKNIYPDLFPETLLCSIEGEQVFTTSLKVAEYFGKRHDHVVRQIRELIEQISLATFGESNEFSLPNFGESNEFSLLNFEESDYKNTRGKSYPMFKISHDGFALLAMGFTGQKALEWKIKFLNAFREMETQLQERNNRWVKVVDQIRPSLRPVVEGTEQNLSRAEIAERIGKKVGSVTYYRRRSRDLQVLH